MKAALTHPTWNQIEQGCFRLAMSVKASAPTIGHPDVIIALVRGGCIPAVRLSHLLGDLPVLAVNYSSKTGKGDNRDHLNVLTPITGFKNALIVDDICDSGESLKQVYDYYYSQIETVLSATLYHRKGAIHYPTHVWQHLTPDDPWIEFPWEA